MVDGKIFGIGLNKTGTKTLAKCFSYLGFERHVSCRRDLLIKYRDGQFDDIFCVSDRHQTFEDWPWPLMYEELHERYSGNAKFILTMRSTPLSWVESLKRHSLKTSWREHCRLLAYGHSYPHGLEQAHIDIYEGHNQKVRQFFSTPTRRNCFLEVNFENGDGWNKLCAFLEKPVPDAPFPHENRSPAVLDKETELQNLTRIDEQLCLLGKMSCNSEGNEDTPSA